MPGVADAQLVRVAACKAALIPRGYEKAAGYIVTKSTPAYA